jgi:hypothetical protein
MFRRRSANGLRGGIQPLSDFELQHAGASHDFHYAPFSDRPLDRCTEKSGHFIMPAKKSTDSKFNKTQILDHIAASTGVSKKQVSAV